MNYVAETQKLGSTLTLENKKQQNNKDEKQSKNKGLMDFISRSSSTNDGFIQRGRIHGA